MLTHIGERDFYIGSAMLNNLKGGSKTPKYLGYLLHPHCLIYNHQMQHVGRGVFRGDQPHSPTQNVGPSTTIFLKHPTYDHIV